MEQANKCGLMTSVARRKWAMRLWKEQTSGEAVEEEGQALSFWQDKTSCWEMCHCPESIRNQCPAPKYPFLPCWQIEGTYLKLSDDGSKGNDTKLCQVCRVYKRYGQGKPIEMKLIGKGLDVYRKSLREKAGTSD